MKRVVIFILIIVCLLFLGVYLLQEKIIFLPQKKIAKEYTYHFEQKFEEVNLETSDKETINALHFKVENPKGIILFFHGNKGNLTRWGTIVSYFKQFEYDVFVMDYRNYGKSTGTYHEEKMYEDALLSYNYVKNLYSEDKIVVYGRSLGCTFATRVAAHHHPKEVILEAPFYNLYEAVKHYIFPMPKFLFRYQFNTYIDIEKVTSSITIFHGTNDKVTPYKGSEKLFKRIKSSAKEYVKIEEGTHHNLRDFAAYEKKIKELLER